MSKICSGPNPPAPDTYKMADTLTRFVYQDVPKMFFPVGIDVGVTVCDWRKHKLGQCVKLGYVKGS